MTERIDLNKSEHYSLSIRLSTDGFSFSIHHPSVEDGCDFETYPINAGYSMTANLKEMLAHTEALKHPYARINILYDTPRFTTIPFDLFEDEQMETLFYHNFPRESNEMVLCNVLGKSNLVILFAIDKHVHQTLIEQFPSARFFATASPLTEFFTQRSRLGNHRKLYAHVRRQSLEVFGYNPGKPMLLNSFPCKHLSDRIYYLLYIWKELGFDQEKDDLYLVGPADHLKEVVSELRHYLRQVFIIHPKAEFHRSEISKLEEIPFDMQTFILCE
ncbi:hypothetical protein EVA_03616 [gut metagenome]|uniref:DUF3822 domain-containing protein n=1 Tax=gut metagenome TaxID=749906 RepID=J9GLE6_9ZZZZ